MCGNHFVSLKLYLCFAKKPIITADLYWVSSVQSFSGKTNGDEKKELIFFLTSKREEGSGYLAGQCPINYAGFHCEVQLVCKRERGKYRNGGRERE